MYRNTRLNPQRTKILNEEHCCDKYLHGICIIENRAYYPP